MLQFPPKFMINGTILILIKTISVSWMAVSLGVPYMGCISQIIFARASSNFSDFNWRNKALTAKLLRQGYRYFKLRKAFWKIYLRHCALVEKYSVSLKTLLQQGISEPEFFFFFFFFFFFTSIVHLYIAAWVPAMLNLMLSMHRTNQQSLF